MAIVTDRKQKWSVWCEPCNIGFESIEESQEHNKTARRQHQLINEKRMEKKLSRQTLNEKVRP